MLSKNQIKHYQSLQQKKYRNLKGRFLAEGKKLGLDIFSGTNILIRPVSLIVTERLKEDFSHSGMEPVIAQIQEIKKISSLQNPQEVIVEAEIPAYTPDWESLTELPVFFFDEVQDPGNLGTIIRTADWFGIDQVFLSENSVDLYNPKVIQATMGSITRVRVHYLKLDILLKMLPDRTVYSTTLNGESIYSRQLPLHGIYLFGNEARGLTEEVIRKSHSQLTIPLLSGLRGPESLNLAVSAGIIMSEIRKGSIQSEN